MTYVGTGYNKLTTQVFYTLLKLYPTVKAEQSSVEFGCDKRSRTWATKSLWNVHTYVRMYRHMYVRTYICTYVHMYVRTYVRMYVRAVQYVDSVLGTYPLSLHLVQYWCVPPPSTPSLSTQTQCWRHCGWPPEQDTHTHTYIQYACMYLSQYLDPSHFFEDQKSYSLAEWSWVHSMGSRSSDPKRNVMGQSTEVSPFVSMLLRPFLYLFKFLMEI